MRSSWPEMKKAEGGSAGTAGVTRPVTESAADLGCGVGAGTSAHLHLSARALAARQAVRHAALLPIGHILAVSRARVQVRVPAQCAWRCRRGPHRCECSDVALVPGVVLRRPPHAGLEIPKRAVVGHGGDPGLEEAVMHNRQGRHDGEARRDALVPGVCACTRCLQGIRAALYTPQRFVLRHISLAFDAQHVPAGNEWCQEWHSWQRLKSWARPAQLHTARRRQEARTTLPSTSLEAARPRMLHCGHSCVRFAEWF